MKAIVATEKNWGIGKDGKLLIHLPGDLEFFKNETMGKVVIMGRKTLESLPGGRALPGRTTVVLTNNKAYEPAYISQIDENGEITLKSGKKVVPGKLIIVNNFDELMTQLLMMEYTQGLDMESDVYVAGGQSIYEMFMPYCTEFIVTRIDKEMDADVAFPDLDKYTADGQLRIIEEGESMTDAESGVSFRVVRYAR